VTSTDEAVYVFGKHVRAQNMRVGVLDATLTFKLTSLVEKPEGNLHLTVKNSDGAEVASAMGTASDGELEVEDAVAVFSHWMLGRDGEELELAVTCKGCAEAGVVLTSEAKAELHLHQAVVSASREKRSALRDKKRKECKIVRRKGRRSGLPRCCRTTEKVAVSELGDRFSRVFEPAVVEVGRCGGRCPPGHRPQSTHAKLMAAKRAQQRRDGVKKRRRSPPPCCAPSKLSPHPFLYLTEESTVEVTWWPRTVVEECGCA